MFSAKIVALTTILGLAEGFRGGSRPPRSRTSSLLMLMPIKGGSIVALVTPMTENNAVDYPKLESLLKWHITEGMAIRYI